MKIIIIGGGITGASIARILAEKGHKIILHERCNSVGGAMRDHVDCYGIHVHDYGPHTFHTNNHQLINFLTRFEDWDEYRLKCGAFINNKYFPTPFNFQVVDYLFNNNMNINADNMKRRLKTQYFGKDTVSILQLLESKDSNIKNFAEYLFENDFKPYTIKQWGLNPRVLNKNIFERVPVRLSYDEGYFNDKYQMIPRHSYSLFFNNLLNHMNIQIVYNSTISDNIRIINEQLFINNNEIECPVVYTGALDEFFNYQYGVLPYRSLEFEWKHINIDSYQPDAVVAYPQEAEITRITEYKKIPLQNVSGTTIALERSIKYEPRAGHNPYYPVITKDSLKQYKQYKTLADSIVKFFYCGRLADFQYYNMDQALERAMYMANRIVQELTSTT